MIIIGEITVVGESVMGEPVSEGTKMEREEEKWMSIG